MQEERISETPGNLGTLGRGNDKTKIKEMIPGACEIANMSGIHEVEAEEESPPKMVSMPSKDSETVDMSLS